MYIVVVKANLATKKYPRSHKVLIVGGLFKKWDLPTKAIKLKHILGKEEFWCKQNSCESRFRTKNMFYGVQTFHNPGLRLTPCSVIFI